MWPRVSLSHVPQWIRVNADGQNAVLMQVYQQPGGNSVQIARDVKQKLADYAPQLPDGVHIANWYDQTQLVTAAAGSVRDAILIGIVLAGLVLFVFLRNTRVILIALIVVPAVLAITVLLLSVLGMSFNMMTLGGMAAAVGLIIDDIIVMLEHIMRRVGKGAGEVHERIAGAAWEFTRPLTGSSAATIVIFLPLAFLSGVTGAFFKALSLTMASALIISYLLTWVAVPLLAERLLDKKHLAEPAQGRFTRRMMDGYQNTLKRGLKHPWLVLVVIVPLLALGGLAYTQVGSGFMPQMDEGGFILDYLSPPGTSLEETDRLLRQVETIIRANPNVDTYSRRTGLQLGGGLTEANTGDFFVRLKNGSRPSTEKVMEQVRTSVETAGAGTGYRTVAADGGSDRRPGRRAAADRRAAVRRRRATLEATAQKGRRCDRQDQRRGRRAGRHQPGWRCAHGEGGFGQGRAGRSRPHQRHRSGGRGR